MKRNNDNNHYPNSNTFPMDQDRIVSDLRSLSEKEALRYLDELVRPKEFIRRLASEDFFWLVKKVGSEDCLPLLKWASEEQWEYLLDLEIWEKDQINWKLAFDWITRLREADINRFSKWVEGNGLDFLMFYLSKCIEVMIQQEDEPIDIKQDFITYDGIFYINVLNRDQRETINIVLRTMATENYVQFQTLMQRLSSILPAEHEEEMYRMKNVRLGEHGFLPFEEAVFVYTPIDISKLSIEKEGIIPGILMKNHLIRNAPMIPFFQFEGPHLPVIAEIGMDDSLLRDRIHWGFAGLCNQLIVAEGLTAIELGDLIQTSQMALGYINLAIEKRCGSNRVLAENLIKHNSIESLFRAGFGLILKLRIEVEQWLKKCWFSTRGLQFDFWGPEWGDILIGISGKKPTHNIKLKKGGNCKL